MTFRSPPLPPPPTNSIVSYPPPSYTMMCHCASHSGTATAPECCTRYIVGGGGCPLQLSPRCPGNAYTRSVLLLRSVFPPSPYTSQMGSALSLPLSGTPSNDSDYMELHKNLPARLDNSPELATIIEEGLQIQYGVNTVLKEFSTSISLFT